MLRVVLRLQAVYYAVTGLWPIVSMETFELVTGPKTDDWLVHMVGLLAASIGLALWTGARTAPRPPDAVVLLAVASAASFAAIDLVYALDGIISAVYLLDAAAEVGLLALLLVAWRRARRA